MKLYWSPRSPFVRKVMIVAHEVGAIKDMTIINTLVNMKRPNEDLLPLNPLSKIPTLRLDDGFVMHDSLLISEYLNEKYQGDLFPTGKEKWKNAALQATANGLLDALVLCRNERDKPPAQQSPEWLSSFNTKTELTLENLEQEVAYLNKTPFSIAHISTGCVLSYLDFRFDAMNWRRKNPNLTAWHAEFSKRKSVEATKIVA